MKRSDCALVLGVNMGNPNGDPDQNNAPRTLNNGHGWITAVSIKSKMRNCLADHNSDFFKELCKEVGVENPERFHIFESLQKGFEDKNYCDAYKAAKSLSEEDFFNRYWDARVFGICGLGDSEKKSEKTRIIRTGPVTVSDFISVAEVDMVQATLTKKAPLREKLLKDLKGQGDMAPDAHKVVVNGVYVGRLHVNPNIAACTGATEEDIKVLKALLKHIFYMSFSAARPAGSMEWLTAKWADHDKNLGSFDPQVLMAAFTPSKKDGTTSPSLSFDEYEFPNSDLGFEVEDLLS